MVRRGLHLAALSSFAIAHQYFDPLSTAGDFFIERGATSLDVVLFALLMVAVPPLLLLALEGLAGLISEQLRDGVHLAFIGGLAALIAWQFIQEAETSLSEKATFVPAIAAGAIAAVAYWRLELVRAWVTVLSPVPLVVLSVFLVFSPLEGMVFRGDGPKPWRVEANGTPVVMVVLDEFPVTSLLTPDMQVDAKRFPAFARLAGTSTWYRNTASVADYTQMAVPALLSGAQPDRDKLQVAAEYPHNLFTLLGGTYRLNVWEFATDLCEEPACPVQVGEGFPARLRRLFADTIEKVHALPGFARVRLVDLIRDETPEQSDPVGTQDESIRRHPHLVLPPPQQFRAFVEFLPEDDSTFSLLHVALPHRPFTYLGSGQTYFPPGRPYAESIYGPLPDDEHAAGIAYQRHLLQLQHTDTLLGELLDRLESTGLLDRALLVVAADHGAAFQPGDEQRVVSRTNVGEIAAVPLFVKAPGQRRGDVDYGRVETVDVLPTIAEALDARLPWPVDGEPATTVGRGRQRLTVARQTGGGEVRVDRAELERSFEAVVRRNADRIPPGRSPYRIGPRSDLVGKPAASLLPLAVAGVKASVDHPEAYAQVDPDGFSVPAEVSGIVLASGRARHAIAITVNGRVATTAWTLERADTEFFTALVPPAAFRDGSNSVEALPIRSAPAP